MEISLGELAALIGGELSGPSERKVSGLKGIEEAGPGEVAFLANPKYAGALPACKAGVVLVRPDQKTPPDLAVIRVDDPYLAYAKLLTFATRRDTPPLGVHPKAVVEDSARLGKDVSIHALAYVGHGAEIGDRAVLHPGVYVGPGAKVGESSTLMPNVVLGERCLVGKRCLIHAGTVIGADGYGFVPEGEGYFKIPQIGIVRIDDDVEIGALNTIDRAALNQTWIQKGVKTDNMVHVAHNCVVGENTLLVAQVGISGSTQIGKRVVIGGQAGLAGHLKVGDDAKLGGGTGVIQDVPEGAMLAGTPAVPHRMWLRTHSLLKKLPGLFARVRRLESKLDRGED